MILSHERRSLLDQKILIAGGFQIVNVLRRNLARVNADGTVDLSFDACIAPAAGGGGTSLALQPDAQILASGTFTFNSGVSRDGIARLSSCGVLDTSYASEDGVDLGSVVYAIALRSSGELLLGGSLQSFQRVTRIGLAQLDRSGFVQTAFNPGSGIDVGSVVYALAFQSNGKAVIGGSFSQYDGRPRRRLARINLDGSLDTDFDPRSGPNNSVSSIAMQSDGRILVVGKFFSVDGQAAPGLVRILADHLPSRFGPPLQPGNGQFQTLFYGESQISYDIQASTDLVDWSSITNLTVTSIPILFIDPNAGASASRFYRAQFLH